jgi:uncharacterized protein (DUF2252 family)
MPRRERATTDATQRSERPAARTRSCGPRTAPAVDVRPPRAIRLDPEGSTPKELRDWGRSLRDVTPRESLADWAASPKRPDPVALLLEQSATRVPELVPIRHGRMLASPFAFYRGAALIMAADLARAPSSGIYVQSCGDAHLSNFGVFATPERRLAFDVNDFDETHPAPFEWDVMRLATSLVIAADDVGLKRADGKALAAKAARTYRERMAALADMTFLDVWYSGVDFEGLLEAERKRAGKAGRRRVDQRIQRVQDRKTNAGALTRLAEQVDGRWRIREEPPLIMRADITPETAESIRDFFRRYVDTLSRDLLPLLRHYHFTDLARKVVGVGSVGTLAYVVLLIGTRHRDPLFLQIKEADHSVLERYTVADRFTNQGDRVVVGQRVMQATSDIFLGWSRFTKAQGREVDFYVRQLNDWKASADVAKMDAERLARYASLCAEALARAHARSGSALAIDGYLGGRDVFDQAVAAFAVTYADRNDRDFRAFEAAADSGSVPVERGI